VPKVTSQIVKISLVALLALILTACNSCGSNPATPGGNEIAATVNGKEIKLSEVDSIISFQTQGQQGNMSLAETGVARLQVLSKMIEEEALYQKAEREKFQPGDDEINREIEGLKQGQTQESFDKAITAQGLTKESFRDKIRRQLAVRKMLEKYTGGIDIKDKEVEDAYNANKDAYANKRGAELASIVVDPKPNNGPSDDAKTDGEAELKLKEIVTQLNQGADFADLARRRSEAPNAAQGGDLGFISEEDMRKQFSDNFAAAVMSQKAGQYVGPFPFNGQAIILKIKRVQLETENQTLEQVRARVTEDLRSQRKELVAGALTVVAMSEAKVVNFIAEGIVKSPNTLGNMRFAGPTPSGSPVASPAGSPTGSPVSSPAAGASPAASPAAAKASPAASPKK
jgi:parvulin-like peptidyl-prolyl isomerase